MKNKKVIILIALVLIVIGTGIFFYITKESVGNKDFKNDYGIKVPKNTEIIYLKDDNLASSFNSKDKLVFLGKKDSKETKKAVKILLKAAKENGIDTIYYYDLKNIDKKDKIKETIIKTTKKEDIKIPTLFLIKDKKVSNIEEGYNDNINEHYEDILIEYTMCTTPDC